MITSAFIQSTNPQRDGRVQVVEIQVDDAAGPLRYEYLREAGDDETAIMQARTAQINSDLAAIPNATITQDDATILTIRAYFPSTSLQLTTGQKSALVTARNVINAVKPFVKVYQTLSASQQQFVLAHSPWFSQVLDVLNG